MGAEEIKGQFAAARAKVESAPLAGAVLVHEGNAVMDILKALGQHINILTEYDKGREGSQLSTTLITKRANESKHIIQNALGDKEGNVVINTAIEAVDTMANEAEGAHQQMDNMHSSLKEVVGHLVKAMGGLVQCQAQGGEALRHIETCSHAQLTALTSIDMYAENL